MKSKKILLNVNRKEEFEFFNSPFTWIEKSVEHYVDMASENKDNLLKKIILTAPLLGSIIESNSENAELKVLDGETMIHMLKGEVLHLMEWNEKQKENVFYAVIDNYKYIAVFPTNKFLKERISYIIEKKFGGIALWGISEGLDNFFDEF